MLTLLRRAVLFESSRSHKKKKSPSTMCLGFSWCDREDSEPLAFRVGAERSIQLSYDRTRTDTFISIE